MKRRQIELCTHETHAKPSLIRNPSSLISPPGLRWTKSVSLLLFGP